MPLNAIIERRRWSSADDGQCVVIHRGAEALPEPVLVQIHERYRVRTTEFTEIGELGGQSIFVLLDPTTEEVSLLADNAPFGAIVVVYTDGSADGELQFLQAGAAEAVEWNVAAEGGILAVIEKAWLRAKLLDRRVSDDDRVLSLINRIPIALFLVNQDASVLQANNRGRTMLSSPSGLSLGIDNRLHALNADATRELWEKIGLAARDDTEIELVVRVPRPDLHQHLNLIITAIGSNHRGAAVFVTDPAEKVVVREDRLMSFYSLSRSEARLVRLLTEGQTLEEISKERGHSLHTLRAQLKSAFRKMDVRRQSELVKVVLTGPGVIDIGRPKVEAV